MKLLWDFYGEAEELIVTFNAFSIKHSLSGRALPDHLCYKCESKASFENIRVMLESESEYLFQSIISGRRIAIVRLKQGIETVLGKIYFLELSDQKPDGSQSEGFDHLEVYPVERTYEEMVREFEVSETVVKVQRPHHTTHDISLEGGFVFRCTEGPLMEKIRLSEMV